MLELFENYYNQKFSEFDKYKISADNYHLNWFGKAEDEGRTEEPTARKLSKAREKGDVPRSQELDAAVMIIICFTLIYFMSPYIYDSCMKVMRFFMLNELNIRELSEKEVYKIFEYSFIAILKIAGPIMAAALIVAIATSLMQVGFIFSTEKLKFDIKKISFNPKKFLEKVILSKEVMFNLLKSVVKIIIVGFVAYFVIKDKINDFIGLVQIEPYNSIVFIAELTFEVIWKSALLLLIFAFVDYKFQRHQYIDKMKMTKQEVKDEYKQMEGDPQIKSKIREKQREAARRRMMQDVPKADVIIRNPTHYAVAIKYDINEMTAPTVVAKGMGFLALKIIELGEQNNVPIVVNKALARTLYDQVEIGDEIPVELYKTVAEVLAYVWKLKGKTL